MVPHLVDVVFARAPQHSLNEPKPAVDLLLGHIFGLHYLVDHPMHVLKRLVVARVE